MVDRTPRNEFDTLFDFVPAPMLVVHSGGVVEAANPSAREALPGIRIGEATPVHASRWDEFMLYLASCVRTTASIPGVLFLRTKEGGVERKACHGARTGFGGRTLVLLHLDGSALDRRFGILSAKLHVARRVMRERMRRERQMQSLLDERGRLLSRMKDDAEARAAAESERDTVLNRLYTAGQDERRRLARDLHDHAGQHLVALNFGLRRLTSSLTDPEALAETERLLGQALDIGQALRRVTLELRPAALDDFGVVTALRYLVAEWSRTTRITAELQVVGREVALPTELSITLYRLTQEALTNVAKHAGQPSDVSVVLLFSPANLTLTVDDNGVGFEADGASGLALVAQGKLGLIGMRERMSLVGGSLELESSPGYGCTVMARVRLDKKGPDDA